MIRLPKTSTEFLPQPVSRVLNALYRNRTSGFHFAGYFLRIACDQLDPDATLLSMDVGPHCLARKDAIDAVSLGVFADMALAIAVRAAIPAPCRLATVTIQLQFTGHPVGERLSARARYRGGHAASPQQAMSEVEILSGDALIAIGQASFMVLPLPAGRTVLPVQAWQPGHESTLLQPDELSADERQIYRRAVRACASDSRAFSEGFWGVRTRAGTSGATSRLPVTPQVANRMGHVQGGILLGQAMNTALAALPPGWAMSSISASYLAPGLGSAILGQARPSHAGRSTAASRVRLRRSDHTAVLEAQTTLVAAQR